MNPMDVINRALAASPHVCLICHEPRAVCTCAAEVEELVAEMEDRGSACGPGCGWCGACS